MKKALKIVDIVIGIVAIAWGIVGGVSVYLRSTSPFYGTSIALIIGGIFMLSLAKKDKIKETK